MRVAAEKTRQALDLSYAVLDRAHPMREQIYQILRRKILTGELAPGEILDEKAIAAKLDVSRTPVREAVKKLSDENLVEVKAQSATRITRIERDQIKEAFLIRRALEVESAGQAAGRMAKADGARLDEIHRQHTRSIERKRFVEAIGLDDDMHRTIAELSGLPRLWRLIDISKAPLDRTRYLHVPRPGLADATLAQHRAIIEALKAMDADAARTMMARHLEMAFESTMRLLEAGDTN